MELNQYKQNQLELLNQMCKLICLYQEQLNLNVFLHELYHDEHKGCFIECIEKNSSIDENNTE